VTQAVPAAGGWLAFYLDAKNMWRLAADARGVGIICETENLALSVAKYRRNRIRGFQ
jgi:hypothetical protein